MTTKEVGDWELEVAAMAKTWGAMARHMAEKHPDYTNFGDVIISGPDGRVISQRCQWCGEELMT